MNADVLHRLAPGRRVKVNSAEVTFDTQHAWSCAGRDVRLANMEHFGPNTTWNTRPDGWVPPGAGWANAWLATAEVKNKGRPDCGNDGEANDIIFRGGNLTRLVQWATDHDWDIFALGIYPDANVDDTHTWKVFDPDPRLVVKYSRYPDAPTDVGMTNGNPPKKPCVQGAGRPWVGWSPDRQLWADLFDVDGDATGAAQGQPMRGVYELYQEYDNGEIIMVDTWNRFFPDSGFLQASHDGGTDAGKLEARITMSRHDPSTTADGGTFYKWRVRAEDETLLDGPWSPWCEFMVDTKRPNTPDVTSAQYPSGRWSGWDPVERKYKPGNFTFWPGGSGDVVMYHYKFSDGSEGWPTVAPGGSFTIPWTPKRWGLQWVELTSYDRAGNLSVTTRKHEFGVEQPPRDAAWSMDETGGSTAQAVAATGVLRPSANIAYTDATLNEAGNLQGVPADRSVRLNGSGLGEAQAGLDTGRRFMFSTWAKLASTTGDQVVMSQQAADGGVFELGWFGGRWTFRHRKGSTVISATRDLAVPQTDGIGWTDTWVSLMAGYDPENQQIWLRTQAPKRCVTPAPDCDPQPVMEPSTVVTTDSQGSAAGQGPLVFGASPDGAKGNRLNGWIDDSQLWPLSHPDEPTLRSVYGETVQDQNFAGSTLRVVSAGSGQCLDVAGGSLDSGANVWQWNCNAANAQQWKFEAAGAGYYTLTNPASGKCLDVDSSDGSGTADGRNVWQYNCNGGDAQKWKPERLAGGYRLVAKVSGKCLDVAGGSLALAADVHQWSCNGSPTQSWNLTKKRVHEFDGVSYRLKNANSGKCADVEGTYTTDQADVWQWPCHGGPNQDWKFVDAGDGSYLLVSGHTAGTASPKCLDVAGGSMSPGGNVWQWNCTGSDAQKWQVIPVDDDGAKGYRLVAKHSGMALEVLGGSTGDAGAGDIVQNPLNETATHQVWILGCRPGEEWRCSPPED